MHSNEAALTRGVAVLSAHQLDQVAGGNAYYELFHWFGEQLGAAERNFLNLVDANGGIEYYY
jgi:hypothetical protein